MHGVAMSLVQMLQFINAIPYIAFFYLVFFGILIVPSIVLGSLIRKNSTNTLGKSVGLVVIITPIAGIVPYALIDYFESISRTGVWWVMMLLILGIPLVLTIGLTVKLYESNNKKSHSKKNSSSAFARI